tara:strand:- start:6068 stop:6214 length:147 start_codon:yes stop_codon:yes gene_type:complete
VATQLPFGTNQCLEVDTLFVVMSVVVIVASEIVWSPVLAQLVLSRIVS